MAELILNNLNFEEKVLRSEKPVIVDFYADWCGPCRMLAPVIAGIAAEHDEISVGKVNVDENPELAYKYGIESIPAVFLFKDGAVAAKSIGFKPKAALEQALLG